MIRAFLIFGFIMFFSASTVAAEPDCGYVDKSIVKDVYSAAERVDLYNDAAHDIVYSCQISEDFKSWDKEIRKQIRSSSDYKKTKKLLIAEFEKYLKSMHGPLISFFGYIYAERVDESRALRTARVISSQKKINRARGRLVEHADKLRNFMSEYPHGE